MRDSIVGLSAAERSQVGHASGPCFSATTSMSTSVVVNGPAAAVGRSRLAIRATAIRSRAGRYVRPRYAQSTPFAAPVWYLESTFTFSTLHAPRDTCLLASIIPADHGSSAKIDDGGSCCGSERTFRGFAGSSSSPADSRCRSRPVTFSSKSPANTPRNGQRAQKANWRAGRMGGEPAPPPFGGDETRRPGQSGPQERLSTGRGRFRPERAARMRRTGTAGRTADAGPCPTTGYSRYPRRPEPGHSWGSGDYRRRPGDCLRPAPLL